MMIKFCIFLLFAILDIIQCQTFTISVFTADKYTLGEDITCKVTITNDHDKDIYLLRRNTPLDEVMSDIFDITQDGISVDYDGFLYQRVAPTPSEYVKVPARSFINSSTDLSQSYSIGVNNAKYTVTLTTTLIFYESPSNEMQQRVLSNTRSFKVIGNEKHHKPTITQVLRESPVIQNKTLTAKVGNYIQPFIGGTPKNGDIGNLLKIYDATYRILDICSTSVDSNINGVYSTWFGIRFSGYMDIVKGVYDNVKYAMATYKYTIYFDGPQCTKIKIEGVIIAYTFKRSTTIYLCDPYRKEPDIKGVNTKLGTILHEFTHAVSGTDDITYGQQNCLNLAYRQPDQATKNADNYHYFTEQLAQ